MLYLNIFITLKGNTMKLISNQRAEKIARNINAMDMYYEYSDDFKVWKFWSELRSKLFKILNKPPGKELPNHRKELAIHFRAK